MHYKTVEEAVEHMNELEADISSYNEWHPIQSFLLKQDEEYIEALSENMWAKIDFFWPHLSDEAKGELGAIISDMELLLREGDMDHVRQVYADREAFRKELAGEDREIQ